MPIEYAVDQCGFITRINLDTVARVEVKTKEEIADIAYLYGGHDDDKPEIMLTGEDAAALQRLLEDLLGDDDEELSLEEE